MMMKIEMKRCPVEREDEVGQKTSQVVMRIMDANGGIVMRSR